MRIVVWNMAGAAERDLPLLCALEPDVAIVPECARNARPDDATTVWGGADERRGLAVFAFGEYAVQPAGDPDPKHPWTLPVAIEGPTPFALLAVWADNDRRRMRAAESTPDPLGPLRLGLRRHRRLLTSGASIVAGDCNHNSRWDEPLLSSNHSYAVADLASLGLDSAYHRFTGERQGDERRATFFTSKDRGKPHHLDHCFVPLGWRVDQVVVGDYDDYCTPGGPSDHAPLVVDTVPA